MKKLSYFLCLAIFVIFHSCKINGSFQGLVSHYNKTKKENPNLIVNNSKFNSTICELEKSTTPKIFLIKGQDLKKCLNSFEKSLIYIWGPNCKSDICYDLDLIQQECNKLNIELFVVAEYFDSVAMSTEYKVDRPIFGIDTKHYKTNLTSKYVKRFIYDITDNVINADQRYIYFENGALKKFYRNMNLLFMNFDSKNLKSEIDWNNH